MNKILVTAGDPGGIGYEILLKTLLQMIDQSNKFIIIVNENTLNFYDNLLHLNFPFRKFELITVGSSKFKPKLGVDDPKNGEIALLSLEKAVELIKKGESKILMTCPISKKAVVMTGKEGFKGHTDYLGDAFNIKEYTMMLMNDSFAVALVTIHYALREVPPLINENSITITVKNLNNFIKTQKINDTIWVCSLNPHAGENGEMGDEENKIIIPALNKLKKAGYPVEGPFPSDSLFKKATKKEGKYFIGMYHDQGLIPVKMLGLNKTVNITLGLPFFRISVEHGTAYDIVGQNKADITSIQYAFEIALNKN